MIPHLRLAGGSVGSRVAALFLLEDPQDPLLFSTGASGPDRIHDGSVDVTRLHSIDSPEVDA